jgi:hypothetical protein
MDGRSGLYSLVSLKDFFQQTINEHEGKLFKNPPSLKLN